MYYGIDENRFNGSGEHPEDRKLLVSFYYKAVKNEQKTAQEGRAVFDSLEYIKIQIPGSKDYNERKVTENDKRRFARRYQEWKEKKEVKVEGIPLEQWPMISASQIEEFKAYNIFSVEQLAGVADGHLQNLGMGARTLRDRAIAYLNQAKDSGFAVRLAQENKTLKSELERAHRDIQALAAKVAVLAGQQPQQISEPIVVSTPIADEAEIQLKPKRRGKAKNEKDSV